MLYACAFLRALATGMIGVLAGVYLAGLGLSPRQVGVAVSVGLGGAAVAALIVTFLGDRFGRRRALFTIGLLGAGGGVALAFASQPSVILIAAFIGMMNGMGRDRGAALVLETAILPATTAPGQRTQRFAWYSVLQDAGHALGSLLAGLPVLLTNVAHLPHLEALRYSVVFYSVLMLVTALLPLALSSLAETSATARAKGRPRLTPESRGVLWRICGLFAIDAIGGGFLTASLITFFFFKRFGADEAVVGTLFFFARIANAGSHLGAAWLAKRIGLVNTMVFTHMPSSLLLLTVAFAPSFWVAAVLFLLREGLVEMDVPTRQSYVMAVVREDERTFAAGITHLVRLGGWAVAPSVAGLLMTGTSFALPLVAGAAMKLTYDGLLYVAFRNAKPPEERGIA